MTHVMEECSRLDLESKGCTFETHVVSLSKTFYSLFSTAWLNPGRLEKVLA